MTPENNFLVAHLDLGKVVEYDPSGKEVWSVVGNILISGNQHGYVRAFLCIPCRSLAPRHGNTLINNWPGGPASANWPDVVLLIEVTPPKKVAWALRYRAMQGPVSSTQLLDEPGLAEKCELER